MYVVINIFFIVLMVMIFLLVSCEVEFKLWFFNI